MRIREKQRWAIKVSHTTPVANCSCALQQCTLDMTCLDVLMTPVANLYDSYKRESGLTNVLNLRRTFAISVLCLVLLRPRRIGATLGQIYFLSFLAYFWQPLNGDGYGLCNRTIATILTHFNFAPRTNMEVKCRPLLVVLAFLHIAFTNCSSSVVHAENGQLIDVDSK